MGCSSSKSTSVARPPSLGPHGRVPSLNRLNQPSQADVDELLRQAQEQERERELLANRLLNEEKRHLHDRALPMMIERRMSVDGLSDDQMLNISLQESLRQQESLQAIKSQKQARRKYAKLSAERNQRWMLFSNADIFDESEMAALSYFMETILKRVPEVKEYEIPASPHVEDESIKTMSKNLLTVSNDDETTQESGTRSNSVISQSLPSPGTPRIMVSTSSSREDVISVSRENSVERLVRLDRIISEHMIDSPSKVKQESKADRLSQDINGIPEFDLPSGLVTLAVATSIIDIMKKGYKLSTKAVHKLLRLTYRSLVNAPTVTRVALTSKDKLTVVGDIHGWSNAINRYVSIVLSRGIDDYIGQLPDLLHIIEESGLPSSHHKYVFNGDFVDRGEQGVEVMCVLMALYLACPAYVSFNRGNHEDFAICSCYGFQSECQYKYDEVTFGMFIEIFNYLPMYTIVENDIIILHGGLFHSLDVKISDFDKIQRHEYSLLDMPQGGEALEAIDRSNEVQFYKQLQRDTLWSDPKDSLGNDYNSRGAGVAFGPDITKRFLDNNNLKMVIRSHECVRSGFDRPYSEWPEYEQILCTIFSASNYSGSGNTSAYIEIVRNDHLSVRNIASSMLFKVMDSDLVYTVHYFHVDSVTHDIHDSGMYSGVQEEDDDDNTVVDFDVLASKSVAIHPGEDLGALQSLKQGDTNSGALISQSTGIPYTDLSPTNNFSPLSIPQQIFKQKMVLLDAFHAADVDKDGILPLTMWSDVMQHVFKLKIRWVALLPALLHVTKSQTALKEASTNSCLVTDREGQPAIAYCQFLNSFTPTTRSFDDASNDPSNPTAQINNAIVEALYTHYIHLEHIFMYFDKDSNGLITFPEFHQQCEILNSSLPSDARISETDMANVFQLMDVKESGEVDINLFFEMFRLADNFAGISEKLYAYQATKMIELENLGAAASKRRASLTSSNISVIPSPDSPHSSQYASVASSPTKESIVNSSSVEANEDYITPKENGSKGRNISLLVPTQTIPSNKGNPTSPTEKTGGFGSPLPDDSIYVSSRPSGSSSPPSSSLSPPTSPQPSNHRKSLDTVDINGIKISIDASSAKLSEKEAKPQVAIDI